MLLPLKSRRNRVFALQSRARTRKQGFPKIFNQGVAFLKLWPGDNTQPLHPFAGDGVLSDFLASILVSQPTGSRKSIAAVPETWCLAPMHGTRHLGIMHKLSNTSRLSRRFWLWKKRWITFRKHCGRWGIEVWLVRRRLKDLYLPTWLCQTRARAVHVPCIKRVRASASCKNPGARYRKAMQSSANPSITVMIGRYSKIYPNISVDTSQLVRTKTKARIETNLYRSTPSIKLRILDPTDRLLTM